MFSPFFQVHGFSQQLLSVVVFGYVLLVLLYFISIPVSVSVFSYRVGVI